MPRSPVKSMREAANESDGSRSSAATIASSQRGSGTASLLSSATYGLSELAMP